MPYHTPLEEFYITMPDGLPSHTAVMETVYSKPPAPRDPALYVGCVIVGSFLSVASGAFLIVQGILS